MLTNAIKFTEKNGDIKILVELINDQDEEDLKP